MPTPEQQQKMRDYILETAATNPVKHDAWFWEATMRFPAAPDDGKAPNIARLLKRIFLVLREGGLWFRPSKLQDWQPWKLPLAAALSHGGRVIIQYPPKQGFWEWLGEDNPLKQRMGASHFLTRLDDSNLETISRAPVKAWKEGKVNTGGVGVVGQLNVAGRDLGVDLAMGGAVTYDAKSLSAFVNEGEPPGWFLQALTPNRDGSYGHLYVYEHGAEKGCGALMIGLEGSSPFTKKEHTSVLGKEHTVEGKPGEFSGAYGVKFTHAAFAKLPSPGEFDSMYVALPKNWKDIVTPEEEYSFDYRWLREVPPESPPRHWEVEYLS